MGSLGSQPSTPPGLYITGLAGKYPSFHLSPESLESFAKQCYDVDTPVKVPNTPRSRTQLRHSNTGTSSFRKLFAIDRTSSISSRPSILPSNSPFLLRSPPPSTADLDALLRRDAVDLAAQACTAALHELGVAPAEITHSVAVTCTNAGNPGYDALVAQAIGLAPGAERALLHEVGCAGGLTALRVAAHAAGGARACVRGRGVHREWALFARRGGGGCRAEQCRAGAVLGRGGGLGPVQRARGRGGGEGRVRVAGLALRDAARDVRRDGVSDGPAG